MEQLPAPEAKHRLMEEYARQYGLEIFVETGTATGASVQAARAWAKEIHSVEIVQERYLDLLHRFGAVVHREKIHLYCGDSASILRAILPGISEPTLFWLDAHCDGKGSAYGEEETPVLKELELISRFCRQSNIVLVDDARLFGKSNYSDCAWPSFDNMARVLGRSFEVKDDIVRFLGL